MLASQFSPQIRVPVIEVAPVIEALSNSLYTLYVINTVIDIDYFYYCYWLLMIPIIIKVFLRY